MFSYVFGIKADKAINLWYNDIFRKTTYLFIEHGLGNHVPCGFLVNQISKGKKGFV